MRALLVAILAVLGVSAVQAQPAPAAINGCVYLSSPPTLTNGQTSPFQCDVNGKLLTSSSGGGSGITIGTTTITSGTTGRVLYDNVGVVGELATTGSGSVVLATSPTLVTPTLGVATGTSLALSGGLVVGTTTIGSPISNALYLGSATPTSANYSALTSGGVLYLNAPTLNSPIVFSSADASGNAAYYHGSRFVVGSGIVNGFSSTTTYSGSIDSAFSRISAGIIGVGTGAAGSTAGQISSAISRVVPAATLPGTPTSGMIVAVNTATVPVIGSVLALGGAAYALAWYNNAQWTVIGN